jgi:hypothetical protein
MITSKDKFCFFFFFIKKVKRSEKWLVVPMYRYSLPLLHDLGKDPSLILLFLFLFLFLVRQILLFALVKKGQTLYALNQIN